MTDCIDVRFETLGRGSIFKLQLDDVVGHPVRGRKPGYIEVVELLERRAVRSVAALDSGERQVGPAVVVAWVADVGRKRRILAQEAVPFGLVDSFELRLGVGRGLRCRSP